MQAHILREKGREREEDEVDKEATPQVSVQRMFVRSELFRLFRLFRYPAPGASSSRSKVARTSIARIARSTARTFMFSNSEVATEPTASMETEPAMAVEVPADSLNLTVHVHSDDDEVRKRAVAAPLTLHLTATDKVSTAVDEICSKWELDSGKVRLWDYYSQNRYSLMTDLQKTMDGSKLYAGQDLLIECQLADGGWTFDASSCQTNETPAITTPTSPSWNARSSTTTNNTNRPDPGEDVVTNASPPPLAGVVGLPPL